MKVELKIDNQIKENKVTIEAAEENEEVTKLYNKILNSFQKLECYGEDERYYIEYGNIESIYSLNGKIIVRTTDGNEYQTRSRIYELENMLPKESFLRISNSEIVNFDNVEKLNLKISGTILIIFKSGNNAYSSRRYIKKIKDFLNS